MAHVALHTVDRFVNACQVELFLSLVVGVCILLRVSDQIEGSFPSTQRYYRRFYYLFNCYMFRSYDHLQKEIYFIYYKVLF
jgi:hypothetical protein